MEFQVKLVENLILKYHITEERPLGRPPETAPPTRMNAPHYPSNIASTVSKQNPWWSSGICYRKGQHCETRHKCKNCRVALCATPFPMLPYGGRLLEA
jgi:hypothetical protein